MSEQTRESRPRGSGDGILDTRADGLTASIPQADAHAVAAARFRDAYAVLVIGKTVRRHLFLSLHSADRAVKRAAARGDVASMVLVRLVPVVGGEDQ